MKLGTGVSKMNTRIECALGVAYDVARSPVAFRQRLGGGRVSRANETRVALHVALRVWMRTGDGMRSRSRSRRVTALDARTKIWKQINNCTIEILSRHGKSFLSQAVESTCDAWTQWSVSRDHGRRDRRIAMNKALPPPPLSKTSNAHRLRRQAAALNQPSHSPGSFDPCSFPAPGPYQR